MAQQRYVIYQNIHKAIRHIMYSTALALGSADFRDQKSMRESLVVCLPNGFTIRQRSTWPPGLPPLPMGED